MLAAQPPRRTSRSSTRKDTESLSSWSTTRLSANLPGKDIRWSVAIDPATRRDTPRDTTPRYGSGYASVANSVDPMTTSRRPAPLFSDELGTPAEMAADGRETSRNLGLQSRLERAARAAVAPAPSLDFDDYPAEVGKREIRVSDAAARIANALHLHLD